MTEPAPLARHWLKAKIVHAASGAARNVSFRDVMLFAGLALSAYGLSFVYLPAAFIAPGVVLTGVAIFGVR